MSIEWMSAAFLVGVLGSLHCIGMCGPIALALPAGGGSRGRVLIGRLVYNAGRVTTYMLLGAAVGTIGRAMALAGWQQAVSIVAGAGILVAVLVPRRWVRAILPETATGGFVTRLGGLWRRLFAHGSLTAMLSIGLLNGFLPCGFLYMALGASAVSGSPWQAAAYMGAFGLGTVPSILATSLFGPFLAPNLRRRLVRILPVGAAALGLLLLLRGLSLGIPYISPKVHAATQAVDSCCHPK
ncbi:MAG TPA: sulfite exporter TauE/SafE family protein [bacterium]|nr:sulfite exporter TauE/SafE family protein [bacterium]